MELLKTCDFLSLHSCIYYLIVVRGGRKIVQKLCVSSVRLLEASVQLAPKKASPRGIIEHGFFLFLFLSTWREEPAARRKDEAAADIIRAFTITAYTGHLFVNHLSAGANRTPGPVTPRSWYQSALLFLPVCFSKSFPFYYDIVRTTRDSLRRMLSAYTMWSLSFPPWSRKTL